MNFEFKFPDVGEGLHEAEIIRWLINLGDSIKADTPIVEVQTDKSVVEIPSPVGGKIVSLAGEEGTVIHVGDILVTIEKEEAKSNTPIPQVAINSTNNGTTDAVISKGSTSVAQATKRVKAAPTVRKLARELGVNLEDIIGTGPGGRIIEEDVKSFMEPKTHSVQSQDKVKVALEQIIVQASLEEQKKEEIPFIGLRKKISEKMVQSVYTIPHATGMGEIDVTKLVEFRESLKPYAEKHGIKLTYLPFIIKAVTKSLIKNPYLNATLDEARGKIILKKYYNIGIATATKDGLIVPVIKNADQKSIIEIAHELESLTEKARQRKIELKDLQGGTFTISSTGKLGNSSYATPIINYPEVAILGIYAVQEKPVVRNKEIVIRSMMGNALSFDHRIIDGQESGLFLDSIAEILENPETLLLEVR